MRIVNPSFGLAATTTEKVVAGKVDWKKDPIALFSNSKPNAKELLEGLKAKLATVRNVDNVELIYKDSASRPAPADIIQQAGHKYRAALLALGD
jgi:hypothetical protein